MISGGTQDGCVPVLPDRIVTSFENHIRHFRWAAIISDVKLSGSFSLFLVCSFKGQVFVLNPAPHRLMQVVLTCACIASRFGMASCAHGGNTKRNEPVPEGCRFPGRKDLSDIGKTKSESRNALDQRAIIKEREWFKGTSARSQAWKGQGNLGGPASAQ